MKKHKKKSNKIETKQRDATPKLIPQTEAETLELAPQRPLGIESHAEFQTVPHKD